MRVVAARPTRALPRPPIGARLGGAARLRRLRRVAHRAQRARARARTASANARSESWRTLSSARRGADSSRSRAGTRARSSDGLGEVAQLRERLVVHPVGLD